MEKLIDANTEKLLKEKFASEMGGDVEVKLFINPILMPGAEGAEQINGFARGLCRELALIEPKIKFSEVTMNDPAAAALKITTSPSIAIGFAQGYKIVYNGAPLGYEATGFIESIIAASSGKHGFGPQEEKMLSAIKGGVDIKVFVTPTCPYCPKSVVLANRIAVALKGKARAECVEASENRALAEKFSLSSVPQQVINDDPASITVGAPQEKQFILQVMKYGAPEAYEKAVREEQEARQAREKLADKPAETVYLTDNNFEEALKKYENLAVDCWAEWCGPCKMLGPVIDSLAKEQAGKIVFGKLNVDENQKTAGEHGIMSIPTVMVFKKGEKKGEIVGARGKEEMLSEINRLLGL